MDMERIEQAAYNEGYRKGYEQGKADAVSVVRCGECKWYNCEACFKDDGTNNHRNPNDFCSYGERREP